MRILHTESELKSSPGPGHEPKDEGFLWPGDLVGSPEHLLGLQHLVLGEGQIPPLPRHRGDWGCDCLHSQQERIGCAEKYGILEAKVVPAGYTGRSQEIKHPILAQ